MGNDTINGRGNTDYITGNAGNDKLRGNEGNDTLLGGNGHDTLNGGSQSDRLFGGDGNDVLIGNAGSDVIEGGAGDDFFYLQGNVLGTDTIKDFEVGSDVIGLDHGLEYDSLHISGISHTYIRQDGDLYAILRDVRPEDVAADSFKQF